MWWKTFAYSALRLLGVLRGCALIRFIASRMNNKTEGALHSLT